MHEWVKDCTRRFAKLGYCTVAPELFQREGGAGHIPSVQDILKIVLAVPRKQVLGDVAAAGGWAKKLPGVRADRVGVTGWCWGGSTVYQVTGTNPDIQRRRGRGRLEALRGLVRQVAQGLRSE